MVYTQTQCSGVANKRCLNNIRSALLLLFLSSSCVLAAVIVDDTRAIVTVESYSVEFSSDKISDGDKKYKYKHSLKRIEKYNVKGKNEDQAWNPFPNPSSNINPFANEISLLQSPSPPPHEKVAQMARYIVRYSNWSTISTISTREPTIGFPFGNIVSISDGPQDKTTGVPYMYVTGMDVSSIDLEKDSRATLSMTLAQSHYCYSQSYDPEDPRCARVILSGRFVKLENGTAEANFAQNAVFARHPAMLNWPPDHNFFFAKLEISNILVLDFFGGAATISTKDYFKAPVQINDDYFSKYNAMGTV